MSNKPTEPGLYSYHSLAEFGGAGEPYRPVASSYEGAAHATVAIIDGNGEEFVVSLDEDGRIKLRHITRSSTRFAIIPVVSNVVTITTFKDT